MDSEREQQCLNSSPLLKPAHQRGFVMQSLESPLDIQANVRKGHWEVQAQNTMVRFKEGFC